MLSEQDRFLYNGDGVGAESLLKYKPGGLHPIILGDVLPKRGSCVDDEARQPRYRIIQKLGHGEFSTVWLARDIEDERYVALKVCLGSDQPTPSNEVRILRHLHQNGPGKSGYDYIVEIFDIFTIRGPNGFHDCVVMEVVLPLRKVSIQENCSPQRAIKQVLQAFNFLHGEGVVHGDPHYENFGIAIPQLQQIEDLIDYFDQPTITPVLTRDPSSPIESLPAYLTDDADLGELIRDTYCPLSIPPREEICLKILDFGRACWADSIATDLPGATPGTVRPPEVHMHMLSNGQVGSIWSQEADIWAIGCIIYHIKRGYELLSESNSQNQIYQALNLGGDPPGDWSTFWDLEAYSKTTKDWKRPVKPNFDTDEAWESRIPKTDPEGEVFRDLLRRMIRSQPSQRSQMNKLLGHPFFCPKQH